MTQRKMEAYWERIDYRRERVPEHQRYCGRMNGCLVCAYGRCVDDQEEFEEWLRQREDADDENTNDNKHDASI